MEGVTLKVERLAYGYSDRVIGRDLSFCLKPGQVVCVLGPNGCGKTTLLRTVLGLLPPVAGQIRIEGIAVQRWRREALARTLGYVPQAHRGEFSFTVGEIVLMGRTAHLPLFGTPGRHDHEVAARVLQTLGIAHLADRVYTQVSGGERHLALIGRALAQEPKLLVLDEPTANLDFGNQVLVLHQMRALAHQGIGILFSTHDPDQAFACANQVLMLRDGRLVCAGAPEAVITSDNLYRVYGVQVHVVDAAIGPGEVRKTCVPPLVASPSLPAVRAATEKA